MVAVYFDGYYKIVLSSQSNEVYFPLLHLLGVGKHQLGEQWASSYGCTNVALFLFSHPSAPVPSTFFFLLLNFGFLVAGTLHLVSSCSVSHTACFLLTVLIWVPLENFYFHVIKPIIGF